MKVQDEQITLEKGLARGDGIAAHITVILYSLKWNPVQFDTWGDPQGNTWKLQADFDKPFPMMTIIHAIVDSYHEYMTANAAKHFDGGSITGAISCGTTLAHNQTLTSKKKFPELAILGTIQAGASWPCNRVKNVLDKDSACPLCQQEYTNCWHTFWTCPHLQNTELGAIAKSQHLISTLDINKVAYFNMAIIQKHELEPGSLVDPLDDFTLEIKQNNSDIQRWDTAALWPSGYYFGDGSGGRYSKYPSLTR